MSTCVGGEPAGGMSRSWEEEEEWKGIYGTLHNLEI